MDPYEEFEELEEEIIYRQSWIQSMYSNSNIAHCNAAAQILEGVLCQDLYHLAEDIKANNSAADSK